MLYQLLNNDTFSITTMTFNLTTDNEYKTHHLNSQDGIVTK